MSVVFGRFRSFSVIITSPRMCMQLPLKTSAVIAAAITCWWGLCFDFKAFCHCALSRYEGWYMLPNEVKLLLHGSSFGQMPFLMPPVTHIAPVEVNPLSSGCFRVRQNRTAHIMISSNQSHFYVPHHYVLVQNCVDILQRCWHEWH